MGRDTKLRDRINEMIFDLPTGHSQSVPYVLLELMTEILFKIECLEEQVEDVQNELRDVKSIIYLE